MAKAKILVVEDSKEIACLIEKYLKTLGYAVSALVVSGEEAIKKTEENKPNLVLMDIQLSGKMDGIEAAGIIRARFDIPSIFVSGYADKKLLERAKITEPFGYILKPFKKKELQSNIEMALYKHKVERERKKLIEEHMSDLQEYTKKIVSAQEEERKRIASELHDGIAQDLAALLIKLKKPNKKPSSNDQNLKSVTNGIAAAIEEIRNISENLLPSGLLVLGLQKSIVSLVNRMSKNHKVKIQFKSENILTTENLEKVKLPDDSKITIYRIIQESLNNAIKHSNASNITINFQKPKKKFKGNHC